jgi:pyruvate kinase
LINVSVAPMELWYTVGPASLDRAADLLTAGATGARLTLSYGTPALQLARARALRETATSIGVPCQIIADLPGQKARLGTFRTAEEVPVMAGDRFQLAEAIDGDPAHERDLPVPDPAFLARLSPGDVVVVGDGLARLRVEGRFGTSVAVVVEDNGQLQNRRGLTVLGTAAEPACLGGDDPALISDIAATGAYDTIALSFVSSAADVNRARAAADGSSGGTGTLRVLAKIETRGALARLPEICAASDGVLAARGDLALCLPWVELPAAVQAIADAARTSGVPWYLATQIAEGSGRYGFPTRAEICDLAHWRAEGCAGVLLAYETAFGANPVAAVRDTLALLHRWPART